MMIDMTTLAEDLATLTEPDLITVIETAQEMLRNKQVLASAAIYVEATSRAYLLARDGEVDEGNPAAWVQPEPGGIGYVEGYPVMHGGVKWRSRVSNNFWEPGTDGGHAWLREDPEPEEGDYIAWAVGQLVLVDGLRKHSGHVWRAKQEHVTHEGWEPSEASFAVWEDLGPIEDQGGGQETPQDRWGDNWKGPWDKDVTYAVGNVVSDGGKYWECLLAHGSERQGTWRPSPATPTIWKDLGPV